MGGCVSKKRDTPGAAPHAPAVKKGRGRKKKGTVAFQLQNGVTLPGAGGENDVSIRRVQSEAAVSTSQVTPETDDQSSVDAASMYGTPAGTPRSRMARLLSANEVFHDCQVTFTDSEDEYELANSETLENIYGQSPEQRRVPYSHLREHFTARLPSIPSSLGPDQPSPSGGGKTPERNGGENASNMREVRDEQHEIRTMSRRMSDPGPGRGGRIEEKRPPPLRVGDTPGTPRGGTTEDGHVLPHLHFPKILRKTSTGSRKHTPEKKGGRRWSEPEPPEEEPSTSGGIVCLPKIRIGLERPDSRRSSFRKEKKFSMFGRRSSGTGGFGEGTPDGRRRVVRMPRFGESVRACEMGQLEEGCWTKVDAASFVLRGKTYMKDKKKILAMMHPIYELLAVDVYHSVRKLMHVAQLMDIPCRGEPFGRDGLPRVLVVNLQFPLYPPSIFGGAEGQDGEGFNVILCFRLNEEFEKNPPPAAFALLKRFLGDDQEKVGLMGSQVSLRDRLKLIASMRNVDEVDMSLTERKLATNYNGKPVLSRPQHVFFQEDNYMEIDIDVHRFSFLARKGLESFRQRLKQMVIDFALIIQGNRPEELPEHVLCCACLNKFDFVSPSLYVLDEEHRERPDRTPRSSETLSVKMSGTPRTI